MFTGLVETLGTVVAVRVAGPGRDLIVEAATFAGELVLGESVAINGVCLTVVAITPPTCTFQVGPETLRVTTLGELREGERVNLERSLRFGDRLGGHLVQGHVDGVGRIVRIAPSGDWIEMVFRCDPNLLGQMAPKGSVAVDGVSLTLVDVTADGFSVALIPHTLANTTLGLKREGAPVNVETDMLAKYVWKAMQVLAPGPRDRNHE
jgi:riboflavin synthase